ncbi:zona pellucida glycoprotein 3d tandem duplicate 1 [Chanos chanos]|uniref:Zona pellucida glycoprotein 3d tandem duplicate 1 n=1 Tax=Chanos chanos TaxID=29144 RepID=A0A6J2W466_CHACN|nr:zona pellucida sperm-binding protein 3-like [Chanos chanos]
MRVDTYLITPELNLPYSGALGPGTQDKVSSYPQDVAPYYALPMFQHVAAPLADSELFRPVAGKRAFPSFLTNLLFPAAHHQSVQIAPVRNSHGVEVWCGYSDVSVRIYRTSIGFSALSSLFYLGTCPVTRSTKNFFYFRYNLGECGGSFTTMNGLLVYSNTVSYKPEPQGDIIRAVPLNLHFKCLYNRFHYSYKIGYVPVVQESTFWRTLRGKRVFSLYVRNAQWGSPASNESFVLGEPINFEAVASHVAKDERVFIDSCFVTASEEPNSTPCLEVINNFGCMVDSMRKGSRSQFKQRQQNVLRFSVEAFLFQEISAELFYLHCTMSVGSSVTKATAKSCTYNRTTSRWEELYRTDYVCSCCDSKCELEEFSQEAMNDEQSNAAEVKFDGLEGNVRGVQENPHVLKATDQMEKGSSSVTDEENVSQHKADRKEGEMSEREIVAAEETVQKKTAEDNSLPGDAKSKDLGVTQFLEKVKTTDTGDWKEVIKSLERSRTSDENKKSMNIFKEDQSLTLVADSGTDEGDVVERIFGSNTPVHKLESEVMKMDKSTFVNAQGVPIVRGEDDQDLDLKEV